MASSRSKLPKHHAFTSPGSYKYIGRDVSGKAAIRVLTYTSELVAVKTHVKAGQLPKIVDPEKNNWIDIEGLHDLETVKEIAHQYNIHPLMVEDILNTTQKAKIDFYEHDKSLFITLKVPRRNETNFELEFEHIVLILSGNTVISFQEKDNNNIFDPIIERINRQNSKTKRSSIDFLMYALIDIVVDTYYEILNKVEEDINLLTDQILRNAKSTHQNKLFYLKREIAFIRKAQAPLKEIVNQLLRDDDVTNPETRFYLKDVYDHILENIEAIDTFRDDIDNLLVNHQSQVSNRMNAVMKTLTVFSAIFMPLTFIVGIYGMNFENMPELKSPYGYQVTMSGMFLLAVGLWVYFKWKKYF